MAGEAARVAVERSGSCRDTRADPPTSRDRGTTARPAFVTLRHGKQERGKAEWGSLTADYADQADLTETPAEAGELHTRSGRKVQSGLAVGLQKIRPGNTGL